MAGAGRRHDLYTSPRGAELYDRLTSGDGFELAAIRRLLPRGAPRVLELAAGSGRVTLPLLAAGLQVTAVDNAERMLEMLLGRMSAIPAMARRRAQLRTVLADMADFSLPDTFGAAVVAATSLTLLDEEGRSRCLRAVAAHLDPGAALVASTLEVPRRRGPTEVVRALPESGADGELVDLVDHAAGRRWTTLAVRDATGLSVYRTSTYLVSRERLVAEAARAGLVAAAAERLDDRSLSGDRRSVWVLRLERPA
jgi:SAM-dependent methyltransferase